MYKEKIVQKVYHTISEVSKELEVNASKIRFYETTFPWLVPKRGTGGNRKYTNQDIDELLKVKSMIDFGMTIEGVKKAKQSGYFDDLVNFRKLIKIKYGTGLQ